MVSVENLQTGIFLSKLNEIAGTDLTLRRTLLHIQFPTLCGYISSPWQTNRWNKMRLKTWKQSNRWDAERQKLDRTEGWRRRNKGSPDQISVTNPRVVFHCTQVLGIVCQNRSTELYIYIQRRTFAHRCQHQSGGSSTLPWPSGSESFIEVRSELELKKFLVKLNINWMWEMFVCQHWAGVRSSDGDHPLLEYYKTNVLSTWH